MSDNGNCKQANIIADLTKIADTYDFFPKTTIYNEGWLLRIILYLFKNNDILRNKTASFLPFPKNAIIYSEGQLFTPFKMRKHKDKVSEKNTHVDGIVGYFNINSTTKSGIELNKNFSHLTVLEAKMFSGISKGTKNVNNWNQISRTVSCMIYSSIVSKTDINNLPQLNFMLLFPEENKKIVAQKYSNDLIKTEIKNRINLYKKGGYLDLDFELRWENIFDKNIKITFQTWEDIINSSEIDGLKEYYNKCLEFNKPIKIQNNPK